MSKRKILFVVSLLIVSMLVFSQLNKKSHNSEEHTQQEITTQVTTQATTQVTTQSIEPVTILTVTEEEYQLLLRVCMSECGGMYGEPLEGKVAVVETIINRCEIYGKTIKEVVTQPYQYSTANNGEPDETVVEAVDIALSGNMYPDDMIYFRTKHYHSFGIPYKQIGNHYFSLEVENGK